MSKNGQEIEVELKFRMSEPDRLRAALMGIGASPVEVLSQVDTYYSHPVRDFAKTDEAIRVRKIGVEGRVTYKGPLRDAETKSRQEIEIAFQDGVEDGNRFGRMLELLGFSVVCDVCKTREPWNYRHEGREFEIVIDEVVGLGCFAEIETSADDASFEQAKQAVLALAKRLDLGPTERRSYLSMLLAGAK